MFHTTASDPLLPDLAGPCDSSVLVWGRRQSPGTALEGTVSVLLINFHTRSSWLTTAS